MKKLLLTIGLLVCIVSHSQKITTVISGQISLSAGEKNFLGYDGLGAFYQIEHQTIIKQNGTQTWQYKNPQLGKIGRVDLINPLKIVVYFETQNTVALLDNQLNETQKIMLNEKLPDVLPAAVGLASGNRLWMYNSLTQKLGLYDYIQNKWTALGTTLTSAPAQYSSDFNYFFWSNAKSEVYRCDVFGRISLMGILPENERFVWANEQSIIYQSNGDLYWFNFNDNKRLFIEIDKKSFYNFTFKDQILSIFTDQGITNYKINLP